MAQAKNHIVLALGLFTAIMAVSFSIFFLGPLLFGSPLERRVAVGGAFTLVSSAGKPVDAASFRGKPFAVTFGFTHCPEVCPTTLNNMAGWIEALGAKADNMRFAFITVDPERDTPEVIGAYVRHFDERIIGLTGDSDQVTRALRAYRVYARKGPVKDGSYNVDHSTLTYLIDATGRFHSAIGYNEPVARAASKLEKLLETTP